jgi:putative radical SAM enzyme (TIGR03279 family)
LIEVAEVLPGSIADRKGIGKGDRLVSINGRDVRDSIDVQFLSAEERMSLRIRKPDGTTRTLRIVKDLDDSLGIQFGPLTIRQCRNKCIFCFVDQMPDGCRRSLYVRDDDYRASFLYGNYITLTNLREEDWERIFAQRLSPLYISVHATEPELRSSLMRGRNAPDVLACLKRMAGGGIRMHTQIVLCPGINDGRHLERTLEDLAGLFPAVRSIAVVPVGLTGHRRGLYPLRAFRPIEARRVIEAVHTSAARWKKQYGTRLAFPSDEFYIQAGVDTPPLSFYEDLPQIENGVGMVAQFLHEAARTRIPKRVPPVSISAVTGASFSPILKNVLKRLEGAGGATVRVITAKNRLFGPSVTVSGLLSGRDVREAVRGKKLGSMLLIPASALKDDEAVFLDDMRLDELEAAAGVPVRAVSTFKDIIQSLLGLRPGVRTRGKER